MLSMFRHWIQYFVCLYKRERKRECMWDMHPMFNQILISSATISCYWLFSCILQNWNAVCNVPHIQTPKVGLFYIPSFVSFLIWFAPPLHIFQFIFPIFLFFSSFLSLFLFLVRFPLHELNDWQYKLCWYCTNIRMQLQRGKHI